MNAVVYDLELVKRFKKGQPGEIVEIGACKVDLEARAIIDDFQIYISPRSGYITKSTRSFINMDKNDMKKAVPFPYGLEQFTYWLGEDYYLCSWGKDDRHHFIEQCVRSKLSLDWFVNYNDIQQKIGRLLTDTKMQLGLKNALALAGIEPTGKAHRGIDDARNTAELLIRFLDHVKLEQNVLTPKDLAPQKPKRPRIPHKSKAPDKETAQSAEDQPNRVRRPQPERQAAESPGRV